MTGLREVRPADECPTIFHRYYLVGGDEDGIGQTLVVGFAGTYRDGSWGNPDASYMYGLLMLARELWHHERLVIDLSGLSYEWGDQIQMVLTHPDDLPWALVIGPGCEAALATLISGESPAPPVTDLEWVFDTVEGALAYVDQQEPRAGRGASFV